MSAVSADLFEKSMAQILINEKTAKTGKELEVSIAR